MKKQTLYTPETAKDPPPEGDRMVEMKRLPIKDNVSVRSSKVSPVLYRAHGVWPFDLAPDEIVVEEQRIVITTNYFSCGELHGNPYDR